MFITKFSHRWMALLLLFLMSCSQSSTTFEIIRIPRLQAEINGTNWIADRVEFQYIGKVVYFSSPSDTQGEVFERVNILAFQGGSDLLQLKIALDIKDLDELVGNYSTSYEEYGGLHDIQWLEDGENNGEIRSYSLCDASGTFTEFVIERQQSTEEIVAGSFRAVLCERTNESDQLELGDGEFRDLEYGED